MADEIVREAKLHPEDREDGRCTFCNSRLNYWSMGFDIFKGEPPRVVWKPHSICEACLREIAKELEDW